jgi:hypothetical protein
VTRWREVPDAEATYWKLTCNACGSVAVKASRRNVQLHRQGHAKALHQGVPQSFTVTPLVRDDSPSLWDSKLP